MFQNCKKFFVAQGTNQEGSTSADHIATEVFPREQGGAERQEWL